MNIHRNIKAWNDCVYWQTQDKRTLKRTNTLLQDIVAPSSEQITPEPLKGNLTDYGAEGSMRSTVSSTQSRTIPSSLSLTKNTTDEDEKSSSFFV